MNKLIKHFIPFIFAALFSLPAQAVTMNGCETTAMQGCEAVNVFSPYTDVPEMLASWDMEESIISLNGTDISSISNLGSDGGPLAQATALDQPAFDNTTNSFPVANFDGVDHFLTTDTFSTPVPMETNIFLVFRLKDNIGNQWVFDYITTSGWQFLAQTANFQIGMSGTNSNGGTPDTNWHVALIEFSDSNDDQSIYIDGVVVVDHALTTRTNTQTSFTLGQRATGADQANMEFYAKFVTNSLLTTAQKNQIGNYYAGKVGTSSWSIP